VIDFHDFGFDPPDPNGTHMRRATKHFASGPDWLRGATPLLGGTNPPSRPKKKKNNNQIYQLPRKIDGTLSKLIGLDGPYYL
jgi:hypothetical protein